MFTSLRQRRNRQARVDARLSAMHTSSAVATIPATHSAAWTFGYAKTGPRPSEHSP